MKMATKTCEHCGVEFSGKRKDAKYCGRSCQCAAFYEANREKRAKACQRYYESHRKERADYYRAWREANREKKAACDRAYHEANREKRNIYVREWYRSKGPATAALRILHVMQQLKQEQPE